MNLLDYMSEQKKETESPLASRLRPTTLDEVVGQKHIIGKDKLLYRAIQADKLSSLIFYGPPGTGKTTLAKVIANTTSAAFLQINATSAGKKDMEEVVEKAKENWGAYGRKTILFIDEIHRFNKSQQDYLLPFVEDGTIVLIGATTENPSFEVIRPLLSRCQLYVLKSLEKEDLLELLQRAITTDAVLKERKIELKETTAMLRFSGGDARKLLNILELVVQSETEETVIITDEMVERLEGWAEDFNAELPPLKEFILPGGTRPAALAHLARTVCRRAERAVVHLSRSENVADGPRQYLNRLSDLLFVLGRALNHAAGCGDVLWKHERKAKPKQA
jgi:replication-associated recombination protein RarA